ncbi:MAG: glutamate mutase L [Comamonadaceae bacterium]|nr:glutamate mutase L [Comamonadaceae bacterium]
MDAGFGRGTKGIDVASFLVRRLARKATNHEDRRPRRRDRQHHDESDGDRRDRRHVPRCLGQGRAATTVLLGDVNVGLAAAIEDLRVRLGSGSHRSARDRSPVRAPRAGPRMSVHGLVHDMTARAAKEAALGAGANLKSRHRRDCLDEQRPVAHPQARTQHHHDRRRRRPRRPQDGRLRTPSRSPRCRLPVPVVFAGNVDARDAVPKAFEERGMERWLTLAENVYPKIDQLARRRRAAHHPGRLRAPHHPGARHGTDPRPDRRVDPADARRGHERRAVASEDDRRSRSSPTSAARRPTSIPSPAGGAEASSRAIAPEPFAKRTVEGDLGVYVNRQNLIELLGLERLGRDLGVNAADLARLLESYPPMPGSAHIRARRTAHPGRLPPSPSTGTPGGFVDAFGTTGKITVAEGKDLSAVRFVIGTGGAFARLPDGRAMLSDMIATEDRKRLVSAADGRTPDRPGLRVRRAPAPSPASIRTPALRTPDAQHRTGSGYDVSTP